MSMDDKLVAALHEACPKKWMMVSAREGRPKIAVAAKRMICDLGDHSEFMSFAEVMDRASTLEDRTIDVPCCQCSPLR